MDIIKALAPYASKPTSQLGKRPQPPSSTIQVVQFNSRPGTALTSTNTTRSRTATTGTVPVVSQGNKFSVYHKKSNLQFTAREPQSLANNRKASYQESVKDRRAKAMNNNRGISDSILMESQRTMEASVIRTNPKPKPEQAVSSRMEQLQKWKKEREELAKQKPKVVPAMKLGLSSRSTSQNSKEKQNLGPTKKPGGVGIGHTSQTKENKAIIAIKKSTGVVCLPAQQKENKPLIAIKKIGVSQSAQTQESQLIVSIVTKPALEVVSHPPAAAQIGNPPLVPVNTVTVNGAAHPSDQQENLPIFGIKKLGGVCHSPQYKGNQNQPASAKKLGGVCHSPGIRKVKKPKGMQFDAVYKEYCIKFIAESSALSDYAEQWSTLLSEDKSGLIPEEFVGDIESSVGQAKLLLDSKLPQFAELLYFYLSRTMNPHAVLACDLEGWWAVAVISIDKVKERFVKLEKLSKNRWLPGERVPLKAL